MEKYKIVASDLDGTLLNNQSQISRENMEAIEKLAGMGAYFVPSSGRTLSEMPTEIKNSPAVRYIIHSNGAVVFDKQAGPLSLTCLPNSTVRAIMDVLTDYEANVTVRHNGQSIVDASCQSAQDFAYYNVIEAHQHCVRNYSVHVDNFAEHVYNADNVEVFSAFFHSYEEKLECRARLEKIEKLRIVEASEYNLEIMNVDAGKGNALYALADLLGIDRKATISLGDSDNDTSIIKAAGLGLAVSNSCDILKAAADRIICSNEEHAIAYVVSNYFSDP